MRFAGLAPAACSLLTLLGCESHSASDTTTTPTPPALGPVAPVALPPAPAPARPDTSDYARPAKFVSEHPDTLIQLGSRHFWLTLTQLPDSTKPLEFAPATLVTKLYAAPSDTAWYYHRVRGYEGTSTFTLRDSTRRTVVFSKKLRKRDFFRTDQGEVLTLSNPEARYAGYSAGLHALVFTMYFGLPYSDVIDRTVLLLDARTGQVKGLYRIGSATFDAIDCDPRSSPDGQALLTCAGQLLRAGRAPLSLKRPHAELRAARFLADTTLLVVYQFGDYHPAPPDPESAAGPGPLPVADAKVTALLARSPMDFVSTPSQQKLVNAFILSTNGRQLAAFRYDGWTGDMGYSMPRYYLPATRTYYLLNGEQDKPQHLVLLNKASPDSVRQLPLRQLSRFRPPRQPQEIRFALSDGLTKHIFYVDSLNPRRIRYASQPSSD